MTIWSHVATWLAGKPMSDEEFARERRRLLEHTPVPVFWLFGKTGSGKSSIVRYLTGATAAEIGNGFRPQTKLSSEYDFPTSQQPVIRFLDTRGLGEAHYDPQEDLDKFAASTHLMMVVVRVTDHALDAVLEPLRVIRREQPHRPVLLVLTCLHEAYPQQQHPDPDPFSVAADAPWPESLSTELRRCLVAQQERFSGLVDRIVAVDITPPEEGFTEPHFGGERLERTLEEMLPAAYRQVVMLLHNVREQLQTLSDNKAWPTIVTYASLAATAAATPIPLMDIPAVLAIQGRMVYVLADLYGQRMQADLLWKMAAALGGQILARFAVRAPLKLIPFVGMGANAALAFVYTLSLGQLCCWYFGEVKAGHVPSEEELKSAWGEQVQQALNAWNKRRTTDRPS